MPTDKLGVFEDVRCSTDELRTNAFEIRWPWCRTRRDARKQMSEGIYYTVTESRLVFFLPGLRSECRKMVVRAELIDEAFVPCCSADPSSDAGHQPVAMIAHHLPYGGVRKLEDVTTCTFIELVLKCLRDAKARP
jgi:hypothetical protein